MTEIKYEIIKKVGMLSGTLSPSPYGYDAAPTAPLTCTATQRGASVASGTMSPKSRERI